MQPTSYRLAASLIADRHAAAAADRRFARAATTPGVARRFTSRSTFSELVARLWQAADRRPARRFAR